MAERVGNKAGNPRKTTRQPENYEKLMDLAPT
jgi:hypothetical protein